MPSARRILLAAGLVTAGLVTAATAAAGPPGSRAASLPSGGGGLGGLAPTTTHPATIAPAPSRRSHGHWLSDTTITEYWPAPERWFIGRAVRAPGLTARHRIDWLYSATGVCMQGEGLGLDGRMYHIASLGDGGWVTVGGRATSPFGGWAGGPPYWRSGGFWRNRSGEPTFPLRAGGWSAGPGRRYVPLRNVSFAPGPSLPLRFYRSIAVDPAVIALGSRVYIPAYRRDGYGGWFVAQDTGGAIRGRRVDVYRSPPASAGDGGHYLTGQRIFVIGP
ncbi:MAG: 3D domain-containing protein [Solirubrobacteraceae bacterium]